MCLAGFFVLSVHVMSFTAHLFPPETDREASRLCRQLELDVGVPFTMKDISDACNSAELSELIGEPCCLSAFDELRREGFTILTARDGRLVPVVQCQGSADVAVGFVTTSDRALLRRLVRASVRISDQNSLVQRQAFESDACAEELTRMMEEQVWLRMLSEQMRLSDLRIDIDDFTHQLLTSLMGLIRAESVALFDRSAGDRKSVSRFASVWVGETIGEERLWRAWLNELADVSLFRTHVANADAIDERLRRHGVDSLLAVPVSRPKGQCSWLIAVNRVADGGHPTSAALWDEFGTVETGLVETAAAMLATHRQNFDLLREHQEMGIGVIRSMGMAIDARDPYTHGHSERVAVYSRNIAQILERPDSECERIYLCGILHDVGKIGVPDHVLRKPGALTDEEFDLIKRHPQIGYDIVKNLPHLHDLLPGILHHHEALDGSGYPHGLTGDAIPLQARILAVADSFDAMTSDRPYRKGMSIDRASSILRERSGIQWDADAVQALFKSRPG